LFVFEIKSEGYSFSEYCAKADPNDGYPVWKSLLSELYRGARNFGASQQEIGEDLVDCFEIENSPRPVPSACLVSDEDIPF
jgi:hypothetical protein